MGLLHPFGIRTLAFTFTGLAFIGSMIYSLPFAVQPLRNAFEAMPGSRPMEGRRDAPGLAA